MAAPRNREVVPGSERAVFPKSKVVGKIDPEQRIEVTVKLRAQAKPPADRAQRLMQLGAQLPEERKYVSREEFAAQHGADPKDLEAVAQFAHDHGLTVVDSSIPERFVRLSGRIRDLQAAFGVAKLQRYKTKDSTFRGRTGPLYVPKELADKVVGVFGLDNRPVAKPHLRWRDRNPSIRRQTKRTARPRNAADGSFTAPQVAALYDFPGGLDGSGQCIALIELNDIDQNGKVTGTGYSTSDLDAYFSKLKIKTPVVVPVGVDGGVNMPGPDPDSDGEVTLDIEVAGAVAPGAKIAVYFAPNTDQGFIDAVTAALHDNVNKPSVISISWGGPEDYATGQFLDGLDQACQDAAALGVTICCAAGDDGSADMPPAQWDKQPHADFPSSSPFTLSCGGTKLIGQGTTISSQIVWNEGTNGGAGGGGVSNMFARPSYQAKAKVPKSPKKKNGRGVPDVAGNADPQSGYQIVLAGQRSVIGGTSAVAPLWAGLMALINQRLVAKGGNSAGFINPLLYATAAGGLRDVTQGNNDITGTLHGLYKAGTGWDACTGLGTPDGTKLLASLGG
jgi:kumamolisin